MNHLYRQIWSNAANAFVAVSELTGACGKRSQGKRGRAQRAVLAAASLAVCGLAQAAPTGGSISLGQGAITSTPNLTIVAQSSAKLAINWASFNVDANERVVFQQPDRNAIALNRVSGGASQINGQISANGQVFILNPNGIVFGQGAQVNVGGLVASQLGLTDSNFNSGNYDFGTRIVNGNIQHYAFREDGVLHPVTNLGQITAGEGGYVVLLGEDVNNAGSINAPKGRAELWSAPRATVSISGATLNGVTSTRIGDSAGNDVVNSGTVQADGGSVRLGSGNYSTAAMVVNTGVLRARTLQNVKGVITLNQIGEDLVLGGTLDASAPDGGDGGQLTTTAKSVTAPNGVFVTTAAANGKTGNWTSTYNSRSYVTGEAHLSAATLGQALDTTNVSFDTADNLLLRDTILWSSDNTLDTSRIGTVKVLGELNNRGGCSAFGVYCRSVNAADIAQVNGKVTTITQSGPKLVINWPALRIEADQTLNFIQPNAQAVAVNRVSGPSNTEIFGKINANGQVFILNPNGVVFRPGAQVNVGSLLASTLALSTDDFKFGRYLFTDNGSKARALNYEASITAANGGNIVLLANGVVNTGTLQANDGAIFEVADHNVTLTNVGTPDLQVQSNDAVFLPGSHVKNQGSITADGGHIALLANVGSSGAGQAAYDALYLTQGAKLQARTQNGKAGTIDIRGNAATNFQFDGLIDASAPDGGAGGVLATTVGSLAIGSHAKVNGAAPHGIAGDWNLTLTGSPLSTLPAGLTPGMVDANLALDNRTGSDMTIDHAFAMQAGRSLSLAASGNLTINAPISADSVHLRADGNGNCHVDSVICANVNFGANGRVNSPITTIDYNPVAQVTPAGYSQYVQGGLQTRMLVNDVYQLQMMNQHLDAQYVLGRDIDASVTRDWNQGRGFLPISGGDDIGIYGALVCGSSACGVKIEPVLYTLQLGGTTAGGPSNLFSAFTGQLDGAGHAISNLNINRPDQNYVGLFGSLVGVSDAPLVKNLVLNHPVISGNAFVGALAGDIGKMRDGHYYRTAFDWLPPEANYGGKVENVIINNPSVTGNFYVGGVAGVALRAASENPQFRDIHVNGGTVTAHIGTKRTVVATWDGDEHIDSQSFTASGADPLFGFRSLSQGDRTLNPLPDTSYGVNVTSTATATQDP